MAVVPAARAALEEQPVLQRGHVDKVQSVENSERHKFSRCASRCWRRIGDVVCARPRMARPKTSALPGPDISAEGCWGLPFSTAKARYAERGRKKAVTRP
jgi:hypothetical protein